MFISITVHFHNNQLLGLNYRDCDLRWEEIAGTNECLNEKSVCNVTDSSDEGMRDGKEECKHRYPAGGGEVSPLPNFLRLILLRHASDCPVRLAFSYCSLHPVNIHPLSVVVF